MRALAACLAGLLALTLAACQTIQGAGKDIESAGKALENAVDGD